MHLVHIFGYVKYWGHCEFFVSYHFGRGFRLATSVSFLVQQELGEYGHENAIRRFLTTGNYANAQWKTRYNHETAYGYGY